MTPAWLIWLAAFLVLEGKAIFNRVPNDTLSAHLWRWFAIKGKPRLWQARRLALLLGLAWLVVHLLTGGVV